MTTNTSDATNFDLEYQDALTDPANTAMQTLENEVPKRYEGKSVEDLIQMHVNLEKVLHRQGSELGQARKTIDLQSQVLANAIPRTNPSITPQDERKPLTADTLLEDPQKALDTALAPVQLAAAQRMDALEKKLSQKDFEDKNPEFIQDLQNPEFQSWVVGSKTRQKLLTALNSYDFDSGSDLWELWKEHTAAKTAAAKTIESKTRAASTIKGAASEPVGKPVYSRARLAELQVRAMSGDQAAAARWNDPAFQQEYLSAYAEGRIK